MIFVTVGSMLPFDRMISEVDSWAATHRHEPLHAQIGNGSYEPRNMEWCRMLGPGDFANRVARSSVTISHAGMGTVLTALEFGTPLLLFPRRADHREHTTDHQLHTARWLAEKAGIAIINDASNIDGAIVKAKATLATRGAFEKQAPSAFLQSIGAVVDRFLET